VSYLFAMVDRDASLERYVERVRADLHARACNISFTESHPWKDVWGFGRRGIERGDGKRGESKQEVGLGK
jgi:hypothetical protein